MAILYSLGNALVDVDELNEHMLIGDLQRFQESKMAIRSRSTNQPDTIFEFEPVGIGKPLSLEILTVYTGNAPRRFLGGKPDLLVVSGVKNLQTFDAAPRAINQIEENIKDFQYLKPGAFSQGSPLVYYTPSLDASTVFISFELVVDSLRQDTINAVSRLFQSAAGLPIFAPANSYLLAGGILIRIIGELANAFESRPFLKSSIDLRFLTSGIPVFKSGHYVIYNRTDREEFDGCEIRMVNDGFGNRTTALVNSFTAQEYKGEAPYMIINIDGRARPELEGFAPKLATASMLEQFYGNERDGQVIKALEEALELYNDLTHRLKAERIFKQLQDMPPNSDEYILAKALFESYANNIGHPLLQIKVDNGKIVQC